ncbi:MAG: PAS domain S-box protein [Desulfitobacteriaceae bacterium]|nr:PAS domain S-box protein [Desulfitobacteriaceae bacterium]MDD4347051.1 PAS domain S-box protein [Desulfitobacteriaceae bacterium]MDD4402322.1 PAS domain S-box protein [Desulfitobacteriaceae bacterium]
MEIGTFFGGELKLRILESFEDGFLTLDREWRFTYANQKAAIIVGKEQEKLNGKVIWEEFPDIIGTGFEIAYRKAMETRVIQRIEIKGLPGGNWYNISVFPSGEGISVHWQDITKEKQLVTALRESREKYRAIFNSMVESFAIIEMIYDSAGKPVDWRYLESNQTHEKYSRMRNANGKLISRLAPKTELSWFEIYGRVALTGEPLQFEAMTGKRCYKMYASKIGGPESRKVAVLAYDITERKKNEEKLTFQANLLSSVDDAVAAYDENGNFTYWNRMAEKVFGWSAQKVIGQSVEKFFSTDNFRTLEVALAKLSQVGCFTGELEYPHKYKGVIKLDTHIKALFNPNGEYKGAVGSFRDITERKRQEEELKADYQGKKSALALVDELRSMDKNKNQFLGILSHELRNPLASIMMSVSLIDLVRSDGKQFRQVKDILKRQTIQLSRLVDDLLDVTRISQNKISLKKESVILNELVIQVLEDYKGQLASKGVELEVELNSVPLTLEADPARLIQVIGNLINNAAKFTARGDTVWVKVCRDKDEAVICVRDSGMGIKPDVLPKLFLPFSQVDSSLGRSSGGLGLGLSIVKGMVELHGGRVAAASEGLGKGAQFTICLPLPAFKVNKQEEQTTAQSKLSPTLRILVIDDIPDVAEIICSLLRLKGHEVISAYNGGEGIAKAKEFHPQVLFCDIGMPGMNGYEIAGSIRRDQELKDTCLIALTGYAQPEDLERARAAGFNRHLAKPVDIAELEKILKELRF